MPEPVIGFKLTWSDYAGYAEGTALRPLKRGQKRAALPKKHSQVFATQAEADAAKAQLETRGGDIVASITRLTLKPSDRQQAPLLDDLPPMSKKLTP